MGTESVRELIFEVREAPEGGYTARALGASIFAEADDWAALEAEIRDAVDCHFEAGIRPRALHLTRLGRDADGRTEWTGDAMGDKS